MSGFKQGISTLFNGVDTSEQDAAASRARDNQRVGIEKQRQDQTAAAAGTEAELGKVSRIPRGRRLLLAATGEQGLPSTLGG